MAKTKTDPVNPRFYMTKGKYDFSYGNYLVDPVPEAVVLGTYKHPRTGNILVAGINLHYLTSEERSRVLEKTRVLYAPKTLKERYWKGRAILPMVFEKAYRTYNILHIKRTTNEEIAPGMRLLREVDGTLTLAVGNANPSATMQAVVESITQGEQAEDRWIDEQLETAVGRNELLHESNVYPEPHPTHTFLVSGNRNAIEGHIIAARPYSNGMLLFHRDGHGWVSDRDRATTFADRKDAEAKRNAVGDFNHKQVREDQLHEVVKASPKDFAALKRLVQTKQATRGTVTRNSAMPKPLSQKKMPVASMGRKPVGGQGRKIARTVVRKPPVARTVVPTRPVGRTGPVPKSVAPKAGTQAHAGRQQYNRSMRQLHAKLAYKLGQVNTDYAQGRITRTHQIGARQNLFRASHQIGNHFAKRHGVDAQYHQSFGVKGINRAVTAVPLGTRPKPPVVNGAANAKPVMPKVSANPVAADKARVAKQADNTQRAKGGFMHRVGKALQGAFKGSGIKQAIQKRVADMALKHPMISGAIKGAMGGWNESVAGWEDVLGNPLQPTRVYAVVYADESVAVMTGQEFARNNLLQEVAPEWVRSQQHADLTAIENAARSASRVANTASSVAVGARDHQRAAELHQKAMNQHAAAHAARGGKKAWDSPDVRAHYAAHAEHAQQFHGYWARAAGSPKQEAVLYPFDETMQTLTCANGITEVTPPGFSDTAIALKEDGMSSAKAFATVWAMYKRGHKLHALAEERVAGLRHMVESVEESFKGHPDETVLTAAHKEAKAYNKAHPKESPAYLRTALPTGHVVHTWYDRKSRNYITHLFDQNEYEKADAMYTGHKGSAHAAHTHMVQGHEELRRQHDAR